jgi:hypothetical protein
MNTYGWAYLFGQVCPDDYWQVPFYWKRMLEDPDFVTELGATYTGLRKTIWKTEKLHAYIDSVATELNESQARNFQRWPVLGQYIWPNPRPVPTTWKGEVEELKYWLNNRLAWMDTALPGVILATEPLPYTGDVKMDVLQNPIENHLNLRLTTARPTEVLLELVNVSGQNSQTKLEMLQVGENNLSWPVNQQAGSYFLRLHTSQGVLRTKIVKIN